MQTALYIQLLNSFSNLIYFYEIFYYHLMFFSPMVYLQIFKLFNIYLYSIMKYTISLKSKIIPPFWRQINYNNSHNRYLDLRDSLLVF